MRLPVLTAIAKAQLFGMAVGFALGLLACERLELSYPIFIIGFLAAWAASEPFLAKRLTGRSDTAAIVIGVASGFSFPWIGVAAAWLLLAMRP